MALFFPEVVKIILKGLLLSWWLLNHEDYFANGVFTEYVTIGHKL